MDKLSEVFDITPIKLTEFPVVTHVDSESKTKIVNDSDFARNNIKVLIRAASTALESALEMAVQSESPRAYEVLANLINTSADLNTKLIDVHQREQKIAAAPEESKTVNNVTNNVVFSGTTNELNELIMRKLAK